MQSKSIIRESLTEQELKEKASSLRILLFAKKGVSLYVRIDRVYIVVRDWIPDELDEFWTFNESQAVQFYNDAQPPATGLFGRPANSSKPGEK